MDNIVYIDAGNFAEYLNQNVEKLNNDELRAVLDNAPDEIRRAPIWAFWEGFWYGRESASWVNLPVFSQQAKADYNIAQ